LHFRAHFAAGESIRRIGAQRILTGALHQRLFIQRLAESIDHPADPAHIRPDRRGGADQQHLIPGGDSLPIAEGYHPGLALADKDNLAPHPARDQNLPADPGKATQSDHRQFHPAHGMHLPAQLHHLQA